ncbi:uncharacterized protein si:ch211-91p5.3 isoform X3 [Pimephales promelas]|uniref:uncharacterized protein si:ch211-91p5.3 isoform X3 n=1 Tax=Pimephales promelas TaxID=90988 RepID=UPI001955E97A|nr:uncharacterized protein si:ch211-91p5.3 isoform X3 [Pimephales promelas]
MSSSQSYTRFGDDNYKNWLKTTESLSILRNCIKDFVEKETETYHNSLRNKPELNGQTCKNTCAFKKEPPLCELCKCWKKEIEAKYIGGKNNMHWENCRPHLWSTEKWEVAKAYMPRGHTKHNQFSQFDVSAILNLMSSCKHFNNIPGHCVRNVINVRNSAMHSPDLKMSKEEMIRHHETVLQLAKKLEHLIPRLKGLEKEMKQFNNILDRNFNEAPCEVDGQQVDKQTMEILDREQQALKDRIEDFISRFEGNLDGNVEEKPQDMKSLLDFLDQNKDLLVNLGPEVDKLKDMQAKVDQHEKEIHNLANRVENLEKGTHDPVLPVIPPKFKNHLYEYCQAKKWPGDKYPVFSELREAQGYRAEVKVNGQTFIGTKVYTDKKAAHQEVAYIALEQLKLQDESTDESSSSVTQPEASCSTSSGINFFGKVTVDLDQEVASDRCSSKEEATEAAYKDLWERFHISAPAEGRTYRSLIMEYFHTQCFQNPTENFVQNDDDTTICKLKLIGRFTFYDKDGSTNKKQAEHQAAKVALQNLSGILNGAPISDTEKNFKGKLKECLDKLGLKNPVYETKEYKKDISEELVTSGVSPHLSNLSISQAAENDLSESKSISTTAQLPSGQEPVRVPVPALPDPQESSSPQRKKPRIDCPEINELFNVYNLKPPHVKLENITCNENFKCNVEINLEKFTFVNKQDYDSKKEATRKTYLLFGRAVSIFDSSSDEKTSSAKVKEVFSQNSLPLPQEDFEGSGKPFYCSLKNINYKVIYTGQGSSEGEAKLIAFQNALRSLAPLFGYDSLTGAESAEAVQNQLSSMLKGAGQKDPVIYLKPMEQANIQLSFCDYMLKCSCQSSKKAARNHLSARILGLLGVKTEANDVSMRNRLNEWFKHQNLPEPTFGDTEEVIGAKATFSVPLTCNSSDWEDSWDTAKTNLLQVLKQRFRFLDDKNN